MSEHSAHMHAWGLQVFQAQSFYEADPELGQGGGPPLAPTGMLGKAFKPVNRIYWCGPPLTASARDAHSLACIARAGVGGTARAGEGLERPTGTPCHFLIANVHALTHAVHGGMLCAALTPYLASSQGDKCSPGTNYRAIRHCPLHTLHI